MSKAQRERTAEPVTPQKFINDLWAARQSFAVIAAVDLDLFTIIAGGKKTAKDIARAAKASLRGTERLLDAMAAMGYLTKRGTQYRLAPVSAAFLVRNRQPYFGDLAREAQMTNPAWMQLADVVRTGKPMEQVDAEQDGREFFPTLVRAIFPLSYGASQALVESLPATKLKKFERILDVAAGSAPWSLPFAQRLPKAQVTVLDYPEVTAVAREFAERFGVADRYRYIEGSLTEKDFGSSYDLVILGHIIHAEGEAWGKKLIEKSYRALKPGGTLLIAEMIPNDTRTGPVFPVLFGLNMLLVTRKGDVFTLAQYRQWLKRAGFRTFKTVAVPSPSPLILATK